VAESQSERIILFLKRFRVGEVKTRLAREIGDRGALELYAAMVADLLIKLLPLREIVVPYFDAVMQPAEFRQPGQGGGPEEQHGQGAGPKPQLMDPAAAVHRLLSPAEFPGGKPGIQEGGNLGQRMGNAFRDVFAAGAERALLIGSDIPEMSSDLLEEYLARLRRFPMVIGPAADGGYYLIGFQRGRFDARLFDGIEWSTEHVFAQTLAKARSLRLPSYVGRQLRDVDTVEDLESILSSGASSRLGEILQQYRVFK
jgi:rSAM/selenodomain-associated transferase 1